MKRFFSELPNFVPGWVWLVGAGPGDPGLITLHAANAIQQADVIVYDALVNDSILELAKPEAELQFAGKRGGKPSPKQRDISLTLVELARAGKRVLRLKGGDPFVFGRGGEEALTLVEHSVPFRVVPGITSGIAALAYAGIPATHRDFNHNITFLTGHDAGGDVPDSVDWEGLANSAPVIVLYMAMKSWSAIRKNLMQYGRLGSEPVAFISDATTPEQKVVVSTLDDSLADIAEHGIKPPAIVVIGEIVRMRSVLNWLDHLPNSESDQRAEFLQSVK